MISQSAQFLHTFWANYLCVFYLRILLSLSFAPNFFNWSTSLYIFYSLQQNAKKTFKQVFCKKFCINLLCERIYFLILKLTPKLVYSESVKLSLTPDWILKSNSNNQSYCCWDNFHGKRLIILNEKSNKHALDNTK